MVYHLAIALMKLSSITAYHINNIAGLPLVCTAKCMRIIYPIIHCSLVPSPLFALDQQENSKEAITSSTLSVVLSLKGCPSPNFQHDNQSFTISQN
jgi:hypothetical protein